LFDSSDNGARKSPHGEHNVKTVSASMFPTILLALSITVGAVGAQGMGALYALALGRGPTAAETQALKTYAQRHGLASACRLLFNLNEFVFID
jgi:hypothetical protein